MPRPRTWLIGLAAILVVAVVAVWQVPQYLDWNRYRATLEALATTTLGRPVTIHGPITLNLLPPMLTCGCHGLPNPMRSGGTRRPGSPPSPHGSRMAD